VHEPNPARHGKIGVGEEAVARLEAPGEILAARVRIRADREDLRTGGFQITGRGSKTLELGGAERSPVAAIEHEHDGLAPAVVRETHRLARGVG
jgi:hypothetical protein